jgi:hypothetical protein
LSEEAATGASVSLAAGATLTISGDAIATGAGITGGSVLLAASSANVAGTFMSNLAIGGSSCGTAPFNESGLVAVGGSLTVNCPLVLAQTTVAGDLSVGGSGYLVMPAATSALTVHGNATFDGLSETGRLTAGAIVFGGNLTIGSTHFIADAFAASGSNTVSFNGGRTQTVTRASQSGGGSIGVRPGTVGAALMPIAAPLNFGNLAISSNSVVTVPDVKIDGDLTISMAQLIVPATDIGSSVAGNLNLNAGAHLTVNGTLTARCATLTGSPAPIIDGTNASTISICSGP